MEYQDWIKSGKYCFCVWEGFSVTVQNLDVVYRAGNWANHPIFWTSLLGVCFPNSLFFFYGWFPERVLSDGMTNLDFYPIRKGRSGLLTNEQDRVGVLWQNSWSMEKTMVMNRLICSIQCRCLIGFHMGVAVAVLDVHNFIAHAGYRPHTETDWTSCRSDYRKCIHRSKHDYLTLYQLVCANHCA